MQIVVLIEMQLIKFHCTVRDVKATDEMHPGRCVYLSMESMWEESSGQLTQDNDSVYSSGIDM